MFYILFARIASGKKCGTGQYKCPGKVKMENQSSESRNIVDCALCIIGAGICSLNFDNWYPLYRQLPTLLKMKIRRRSYLGHFRRSLDRVVERTQVRSGPLNVIQDTM